jgi:hypothetical protein
MPVWLAGLILKILLSPRETLYPMNSKHST